MSRRGLVVGGDREKIPPFVYEKFSAFSKTEDAMV